MYVSMLARNKRPPPHMQALHAGIGVHVGSVDGTSEKTIDVDGGQAQDKTRSKGAAPAPALYVVLERYRNCNTQPCGKECRDGHTDDGAGGESVGWSHWSACSKTCGGGTQTAHRSGHRARAPGYRGCPFARSRVCNTRPCVVHAASAAAGRVAAAATARARARVGVDRSVEDKQQVTVILVSASLPGAALSTFSQRLQDILRCGIASALVSEINRRTRSIDTPRYSRMC